MVCRFFERASERSFIDLVTLGTIRLWQTTPGTNYGLWQGPQTNGG
jgi:hypothetical protein